MGPDNEIDRAFVVRGEQETDGRVGQVTAQVSRLQHQIEQLDVHVDELRSRLGAALSPDSPTDSVSADTPDLQRQSSELAALIEGCADRVQRLRYIVSAIHDRVDL